MTVIVHQLYRGNIQNLKQTEITHSKQIIIIKYLYRGNIQNLKQKEITHSKQIIDY